MAFINTKKYAIFKIDQRGTDTTVQFLHYDICVENACHSPGFDMHRDANALLQKCD